jgi:hypothetical protein
VALRDRLDAHDSALEGFLGPQPLCGAIHAVSIASGTDQALCSANVGLALTDSHVVLA